MNIKEFEGKITDQIEDINRIKNRLKFLDDVYRMGRSKLDELEAFADMTHGILETDIDVLKDIEDSLSSLLGLEEGGAA